jgi:hypothetical protein
MQNRRSWTGSRRAIGLLAAIALAVGLFPAAASADPGRAHPTDRGRGLTAAELGALRERVSFDAAPVAPTARAGGVSASAVLSQSDPMRDSATKSDIAKFGARLTNHSLRVSVTVPGMTNPTTDPVWQDVLKSHVVWGIDAGGDGTFDRLVFLVAADGGLDAWVTGYGVANPVPLCAGNATYETGGNLAVQVPSGCIGSPAQITFGVVVRYNWTEATPARDDDAPNGDAIAGPVLSSTTTAGVSGGIVLGSNGELWPVGVGSNPTRAIWSEYSSVGTPRGVAMTPDGGHGYVVSGSGRLFGISLARNNLPPRVYGAKSWPNQNVARGVAIRPNGSAGLVVDGNGALYPFGIGGKRAAPTLLGVPKWPGVDMARGVAVMPDGSGGFTLDAFGGLNWFSIGTTKTAPAIIGRAAFPGDDARGVSILPDGTGGFVIDRNSQLHFFSIGTARSAPSVTGTFFVPGDTIRGIGLVPGVIGRP